MLRTIPAIDKSVRTAPTVPQVIAAAATTTVLPDVTRAVGEYAGRLIQNAGSNPCFYAFGHDCDSTYYNGILNAGNQVDCTAEFVSVWSAAGTTIATTVLIRYDNAQNQAVQPVS